MHEFEVDIENGTNLLKCFLRVIHKTTIGAFSLNTQTVPKEELDEILDQNIDEISNLAEQEFPIEDDNADWNPDDPSEFASQFGLHLEQDAPIDVCFVCSKPIQPGNMACFSPCGHTGCYSCLRQYKRSKHTHPSCPVCTAEIDKIVKCETTNATSCRDLCQTCLRDLKNQKATVSGCGHIFCISCAERMCFKKCPQCKAMVWRALKLQVHVKWTIDDWKCKCI